MRGLTAASPGTVSNHTITTIYSNPVRPLGTNRSRGRNLELVIGICLSLFPSVKPQELPLLIAKFHIGKYTTNAQCARWHDIPTLAVPEPRIPHADTQPSLANLSQQSARRSWQALHVIRTRTVESLTDSAHTAPHSMLGSATLSSLPWRRHPVYHKEIPFMNFTMTVRIDLYKRRFWLS